MYRRFRRFLALLAAADAAVTVGALALAELARRVLVWGKYIPPETDLVGPAVYVFVALAWPVVFQVLGVYSPRHATRVGAHVRRLSRAVPVAVFVLAGVLYFTFREVSRLLVVYFALLDWALLVLLRAAAVGMLWALRGHIRSSSRVLVVGAGEVGLQVARNIERDLTPVFTLVGFADDEVTGQPLPGLPVVGRVADAARLVEQLHCDEVIIALPGTRYADLERLVHSLEPQPVRVRVVPDHFRLALVRAEVETLAGIPLVGLREPVIEGVDWAIKRTFDLVVAALGLLVLWPVMLLIGLAIKLDSPGPVLFRQQRVGENGQLFWMYKFRTMVAGAERMGRRIATSGAPGQMLFKVRGDPRVTRVGRFLRRTSLDELPQLVNVLRGEMSLVGPRPEQTFIVEEYEPWQRQRLAVPPGMTGWWQVSGRSDRPLHLNIQYDLFYIRNYSLWLDLRILWKTVGAVVRGEGAY